ncbi:class I adenylate-forming enzyme family protein [Paremcibacter congregatus]|uniref:class I adenylate-forming enzyme family protein n=1 Tax=Paremcibacter congregatus TaxID=2043170 RepID=UPI0011249680|nr:class I adenylate-forming enzyme family protein [Paremcibacter congregatus]QDE26244.1 acyl--CoA ligase [Paremcibacter congregatus]
MSMIRVYTRICDYVTKYTQETPEREAVVYGDQRISYGELQDQVYHCAKALLAMGVKKGDVVATLCTPRPEYWVIFLATTSIGAIWMGLNPKYSLEECRYIIGDAKPKRLFAMAEFEGRDYSPMVSSLLSEFDFLEQAIALTEPMPGAMSYGVFLEGAAQIERDIYQQSISAVDTMDPALLVYTSGSSGRPKGALLSHYGLCFGATAQNQHFKVTQPSIICSFPINHVACVADTCCVILVAGGTIYFQERFDPTLVLKTVAAERISLLGGVPTMILMLLDHPDFKQTDLTSVELFIWGGAAMPEPTIIRLQKLFPRLMNVYGMTETAANTTYSRDDASLEQLRDTIGHPSPYMPCRIVNTEGKICEIGEQGELQFKGDYLLLEYLNRPEATRDVYTHDGWLHTGDVGYLRDDGAITLIGRMSDMFKSGGYNVYPREIELLLESHPSVDMAAVVGVPDPLYQEVGAAYIQLKPGCEATGEMLQAFCKESLANYKIPKHFILTAELPMLPVGKVDKVTLKKRSLNQTDNPTTSQSQHQVMI